MSSVELPSRSFLSGRDVLVWICDLSQHERERTALAALLSPDEHIRANRFAFERDRSRFILSHGLLRMILSRYVEAAPERIELTTGPQGKPAVQRWACEGSPIEFSLSHSGHYAAVAVAKGAVGVDIEVCRPDVEAVKLAQRFFAPLESERIAQAPAQAQPRLFYRYWTGKEAYLKGLGVGLSHGLDRFELLFDDELTRAQVRVAESARLDRNWSVHSLSIEEHVAGAVACEGEDCRVRMCMATTLFR